MGDSFSKNRKKRISLYDILVVNETQSLKRVNGKNCGNLKKTG